MVCFCVLTVVLIPGSCTCQNYIKLNTSVHKDVHVRSELTLWLEIVIISSVHFTSDVNSQGGWVTVLREVLYGSLPPLMNL